MATHLETGKKGEELAAEYLLHKGYKILHKNWRNRQYEIDLVARDGDNLVVVEVKTRHSPSLVEPEFAVDKQKQKLLVRAANSYVLKHGINLNTRFDIIAITIHEEQAHIHHIPDAFYPTMR